MVRSHLIERGQEWQVVWEGPVSEQEPPLDFCQLFQVNHTGLEDSSEPDKEPVGSLLGKP